MTNKDIVIDLYRKGYSMNHIVYKIFNNLNRNYYSYFKETGKVDKNKYRSMDTCRNFAEQTILDYLNRVECRKM